ncbi:MAG: (deoxy)nucleoside triphosphate pyrophosphohydrolase [Desulfovibrionaceae bacterium]
MREVYVVAGVLWRDGRCLAVTRPAGYDWAGWWEFPGGKIAQGETREAALARELKEELDCEPLAMEEFLAKRHVYPEYAVNLWFYHVTEFSGEPRPCEGQELAWIDPAEPGGREFLPADIEILERLARPEGRPRGHSTPRG